MPRRPPPPPSSLSRRVVVKAGLIGAGALVGCEDRGSARVTGPLKPPDDAAPDAAPPDAAPRADAERADAAIEVTPREAPAAEAAPDLSDDQLLAAIDTVVVLCMENRSFDHMLGARLLLEDRPVDGLRATMSNPGPDGRPVFVAPLGGFVHRDPPHGWDPVHRQWNDGAMDGFVREMPDAAADVMGYFGRAQVPLHWGLADHFVTCDRWFSSVLGGTWPNRMYLHGGTSNGLRENAPALGFTSIFSRLDEADISHANYFVDVPWAAGGYFKVAGNVTIERFFADAAAGQLPRFSLIDPGYFGVAANDDHPDHDVRLGQAFIASVYGALRASPQWNRLLFVITYDEHGGFFDHVPPPEAVDPRPEFRRLGIRVPGLVAGGPVRRGATVSKVFDHTTVAATLTRRFGLRPLNDRVRATNDLAACIDPALVGRPQPAPLLPPPPPVVMSRLATIATRTRGRPASHPELWDMAESGQIPRHLDRRPDALGITRRWLEEGARLKAVNLI